jgi:ubiquinone/menaquinone biosynthesis C-methylase UbiE
LKPLRYAKRTANFAEQCDSSSIRMKTIPGEFTRFEHDGWQRVADKYDSVWSRVTRQFIPYLIDAAGVLAGMPVLDVACGPGYVSAAVKKLGANPTGVDFSKKMVEIATKMFPGITFREGDAQELPVRDASYDRVLMNFGLLHLSQPEKACAEAFRVLRSGGKLGFTIWAEPHENPGGKIVNDAIEAHADLNVEMPEGPSKFLYADKEECRKILERDGFDGESVVFETDLVEWNVPTPDYLFEAERDAGVRTAGLLARQSSDRLDAIRRAIEDGVGRYAKGDGFAIPMAAHVIVASKRL